MSQYYIGVLKNHKREVFTARAEPTKDSHGHKYLYVIGPFSTKAGAEIMQKYGDPSNPHFQHVSDAESYARRMKKPKGGKKGGRK